MARREAQAATLLAPRMQAPPPPGRTCDLLQVDRARHKLLICRNCLSAPLSGRRRLRAGGSSNPAGGVP